MEGGIVYEARQIVFQLAEMLKEMVNTQNLAMVKASIFFLQNKHRGKEIIYRR